jgi:hypothetical protein
MILKIKRFLKLDIRWKLKRISKKININLYPSYFYFEGLKSFYTKIIFNLIFYEKVFKKKKIVYSKVSKIYKNKNNQTNFIFSPPSSGSNYLRNFFSSYFEMRYKIGNGIPKFDNYSDNRWMYSDTPIIKGDLFNNIILEDYSKKNEWKFYDEKTFFKERIGMSRYPLQGLELFKLSQVKPLILIRKPNEWLISMYLNKYKANPFYKKFTLDKKPNIKLIKDSSLQYQKFVNFWRDYLKNKSRNEYLIIKFEDIVNESKKKFLDIINFFGLEVDNDKIDKSIYYNSKEFIMSDLKSEFQGTRFSNPEKKQNIIDEISDQVKKFESNYELDIIYNQLINN